MKLRGRFFRERVQMMREDDLRVKLEEDLREEGECWVLLREHHLRRRFNVVGTEYLCKLLEYISGTSQAIFEIVTLEGRLERLTLHQRGDGIFVRPGLALDELDQPLGAYVVPIRLSLFDVVNNLTGSQQVQAAA
jgi:hypothetical protein